MKVGTLYAPSSIADIILKFTYLINIRYNTVLFIAVFSVDILQNLVTQAVSFCRFVCRGAGL